MAEAFLGLPVQDRREVLEVAATKSGRPAYLLEVAEKADRSSGAEAVARAVELATLTIAEDTEETSRGRWAGVLPGVHQFEFRTGPDYSTTRGRVSRARACEARSLRRHTRSGEFYASRARLARGRAIRLSYLLRAPRFPCP